MIVLGYIEIHLKGCIGNINGDGIKCCDNASSKKKFIEKYLR